MQFYVFLNTLQSILLCLICAYRNKGNPLTKAVSVIRLYQNQEAKSNTSAKGLLGIADKLIGYISDSQQAFRACVRLFCFVLRQPELK